MDEIRDIYRLMREEDEKESIKQKELLDSIKKEMSESDFESMMEFIEEDRECYYGFEIVSEPIGTFQKSDNYWVNQTTNGGYLGDEFAGTLCFFVSKEKYLKVKYSM